MINQSMTILFVRDQAVASKFYQELFGTAPSLNVPGMTEFKLDNNLKLGLMPLAGIKTLLGEQHFSTTNTRNPTTELYLTVSDPDAYLKRAVLLGAKLILPLEARDWGDRAGYCQDLDGHVLAFAEPQ